MIGSHATSGDFPDDNKREFMMAALRRACAHLRATALELEEIGISLKFNIITPEGAVSWLSYIGAVDIINAQPWTNRIGVIGDEPVPPASPEAAATNQAFSKKMAPGGDVDRILRGGA